MEIFRADFRAEKNLQTRQDHISKNGEMEKA